MKVLVFALVAVLAPSAPREPRVARPAHRALPWLFNVANTVAVDSEDPSIALPLGLFRDIDPTCEDVPTAGLRVTAEVAPSPGRETVVASYAYGVLVLDSEGTVIAAAPGYSCEGSADQIEVLAAGTAFGVPTIVVVGTTGGRREQLTWLGMFRVGLGGRLDPVFTGAVEQREDGIVRRGSVTVLPGALLVRDPFGGVGFWVFDRGGGVYIPRGGYSGLDVPHS